MNTVFLGTPEVAVPFLNLVHQKTKLKAAVSKQDAPSGRGQKLSPSPVKARALELGLNVFTPQKSIEIVDDLNALEAEAGIVVAYGQLLKPDFLKTTKHGYLNVHFSLLPKYRGAAPVQRALMNGETKSGVTIFWIDKGMDTGDIFAMREAPVLPEDNAKTLMDKLVKLGLVLLEEVIGDMQKGVFKRLPQEGTPSLANMLKKEEAYINFCGSAQKTANLIRGLALGPHARACYELEGKKNLLQLLEAKPVNCETADAEPGTIVKFEKGAGFVVKCGTGDLLVTKVKPEGKKEMNAYDFALGSKIQTGLTFMCEEL